MENDIFQRIRLIYKSECRTIDNLAQIVDVPSGSIKNMFSKRSKPSSLFLEKILSAFPRYSANWLLTGNGEMLEGSSKPYVRREPKAHLLSESSAADMKNLGEQVDFQKRMIETLSETIKSQQSTIAELQAELRMLRETVSNHGNARTA